MLGLREDVRSVIRCGWEIGAEQLDEIQETVRLFPALSRWELAQTICEHLFSYDWNAMKGYHYLMRLGRLINVLAIYSERLVKIAGNLLSQTGMIPSSGCSCFSAVGLGP